MYTLGCLSNSVSCCPITNKLKVTFRFEDFRISTLALIPEKFKVLTLYVPWVGPGSKQADLFSNVPSGLKETNVGILPFGMELYDIQPSPLP